MCTYFVANDRQLLEQKETQLLISHNQPGWQNHKWKSTNISVLNMEDTKAPPSLQQV